MAVLPLVEPHVAASTINRKLAALAAFYAHQARHGVDVGELLTTWQLPGRREGVEAVPAPRVQGQAAVRCAIGRGLLGVCRGSSR